MSKTAAVVGSGLGGLAAAIRLKAKGYDVDIYEALDQPGGRASVFKKDGYTFDAGPTVITAPYLVAELFELAGKDMRDYIEMIPVDPFYRVVYSDGSQFDYVGDEERILKEIEKISPQDVEGYKKLAKQAEKIFKVGYSELVDHPFEKFTDMLKIAPKMIQLKNYKSVYSLVSDYIKDERLRQAFSFQPLLIGGNPFDSTSIYLLIHWLERKWGVFYPKGGTTHMVHALVQLFKDMGGRIHLNAPVEEILVDAHKVKGVKVNGESHLFDAVVCNSDPSFTYMNMIAPEWRKKHTDKRIKKLKPSMSLFVTYFGTKKKYDDIAHHTILLGPRYKGLLNDIFHKYTLPDDFSLYLHAPAKSDPDMAPEGKEAFYVLSPVPNQYSKADWKTLGPLYQEKILKALDSSYLPGLLDNLELAFSITPDYFEKNLRSVAGSAFGLEPVLRQSAYFRYHNRSEDINNLFFVGASTHPGAGIPGVLNSAKVLEKVLNER